MWTITAMAVYLISIAEGDPVANGKWICMSESDTECTTIKNLPDKQEMKDKFCGMNPEQWEWTSR